MKFKRSRFKDSGNSFWNGPKFGAVSFCITYWFRDRKWYLAGFHDINGSYQTLFHVEISKEAALKLLRSK